jgi:hypothetical protein
MKILSVRGELFLEDEHKDMTKLMVAFRKSAKTPKELITWYTKHAET